VGARRGRVIALLLSESALVATGGGVVGLAIAAMGIDLLDWLRPTHMPRQSQIAIDSAVTAFMIAVSTAVCLVCGLVPALRLTRGEPIGSLRAGRTGTSGAGIRRLQRALVIAEVALSIVPLVGGGLMLRTFWNLTHAPLGFDASGLVTARVQFNFREFPGFEQRWRLIEDAMARVRELPGVEEVSAAGPLPYASPNNSRFAREGDPAEVVASQQPIAPGYLALTRTRLIQGRDVSNEDIRLDRMVAVVDQRLADRFWPAGAIGQRLIVRIGTKPVPVEVVGVTAPVRAARITDSDFPHVFLSYNIRQVEPWLVIKTSQSASSLAPELRRVVESLGTGRPVVDIRPMRDYIDMSIDDTRFTMLMLTMFAAASLLLAGVGMYGTLAYLTSQRTQEFGVRMALGATARAIMVLVVREGVMVAAVGGVLGSGLALAVAGGLRGLLYGVAPLDPTNVVAVTAMVVLVVLAAASVPAWRASRLAPVVALRNE
jgi:putative ABC transport system permease protein